MGCNTSTPGAARTKQINDMLKRDNKSLKHQLKILLLGTGESGKSTIIKQMKIIYGQGFSAEERKGFKPLVCRNILRSSKAMIDAMDVHDISLGDSSLEEQMYELLDIEDDDYDDMTPEHANLYKKLWADSGFQAIYKLRSEYQLSDSTKYFFGRLDAISDPGYIADKDDVLRAREATTGIHEFTFDLDQAEFRMLDVGGQRSERRKWIHCFEHITSVIFIVACSEYDQMLIEEREMNRMVESVALFEQIINYYWFKHTSFILFLNKRDILEEKLQTSHLNKYFPDYKGPQQDVDSGMKFIQQMYEAVKPETHELFAHYTVATDTKLISKVFDAVKKTLITRHLKSYGLYNN